MSAANVDYVRGKVIGWLCVDGKSKFEIFCNFVNLGETPQHGGPETPRLRAPGEAR